MLHNTEKTDSSRKCAPQLSHSSLEPRRRNSR